MSTTPVKATEPLHQVISGAAGTGKTTYVREILERNPGYGVFSATTGIAAINLDTTTINSILGYFDLDSIQDAYASGRLTKRLAALARSNDRLFVDEMSMLDGRVWDIVMLALDEVNARATTKEPLGITLVGDFCQLQPVKGQWVFESAAWERFAENITRLTTFYRQEDKDFLEALQFARAGQGKETSERFRVLKGVKWKQSLDFKFDGTTIVGTNAEADRINNVAIVSLPSKRGIGVLNTRWGLGRGEWKHIPDKLNLKIGAYVMILANDQDPVHRDLGILEYANGSCGHIVDAHDSRFYVELSKNGEKTGKVVSISAIDREYLSKEEELEGAGGKVSKGQWDEKKRRFIHGGIHFFPLRAAYASTVHKSQGLTLDKIQIDLRHPFMGDPAMMYVALSRCRTPQGLTIVGSPEKMALRVKIHEAVRPWL